MLAFLRRPLDDLMDAMEPILRAPRSKPALLAAILSLVCTWLLYVPVHELLHVFGLVSTGGSITALELQPIYGGHLLARVFPFVVPGGEYAGRLTEFDTYGSDSTYLAADFAPYLLAILGVPLLRLCALRRRPILFGPAAILSLSPFVNVAGDYYEMTSILTTRALTLVLGGGNPPAFEALRSDDLVKLVGQLLESPASLGLEGGAIAAGWTLVGASIALGIALAYATYALGVALANRVPGRLSEAAGDA